MPASLDRLLRPRSVALVGASSDPSRTSGRPLGYLRKHGFRGTVLLVNPRAESIDGLACYPSVDALPEVPDVGLVLLGRERAIEAVRSLAARGAAAAIVLGGGYAEVDAVGAAHQADLRAAAGEMRLLGPNTIGLVNVAEATALSASIALEISPLPVGGVSVVAQSGGMLSALLSRGAAHGVGFSSLIATGNEADVDVCEVVEYLLGDPSTAVIALYVESVRRPDRFRQAAERARDVGKPLVVLKVGRSAAGAQSATSHTGAMAGADRLYDALFQQTGAVRVQTLSELIDVSAALSSSKRLHGRRLAILTSTGGGAALVADACGLLGFEVPPPDAATAGRLRALLVGEAAVGDRNPVDLTLAGIHADIYRQAIAALLDSPGYDALVVVVGASGLAQPDLAAEPILAAAATSSKPIVVYVSPHALNIVARLNQAGVPAFDSAEGCAAGLAALMGHPTPQPPPRQRGGGVGFSGNKFPAPLLFGMPHTRPVQNPPGAPEREIQPGAEDPARPVQEVAAAPERRLQRGAEGPEQPVQHGAGGAEQPAHRSAEGAERPLHRSAEGPERGVQGGAAPPGQRSATGQQASKRLERGVQGGAAPPGKGPSGPGALDEVEAKRLFAEYGIPSVREWCCATAEEAEAAARAAGGPVVLKVRGVLHKSDVNGVRLGLRTEDIAGACRDMPGPHGWVVQEQVTQGVEMLLGLVRDPQLGPALMLGAGGTATEVFQDTAARLLPLRPGDAEAMLDELKVKALLDGFRGRPRADVAALLKAVEAFTRLADQVDEAEINPLFVLPEGLGVLAADGLVVLAGQ